MSWANDEQACGAIQLLLEDAGMENLWTDRGPTDQAIRYLDASPLSSGEVVMLRAAFALWNFDKTLTFESVLHQLDVRCAETLLPLVFAFINGDRAIEKWIAQRAQGRKARVAKGTPLDDFFATLHAKKRLVVVDDNDEAGGGA